MVKVAHDSARGLQLTVETPPPSKVTYIGGGSFQRKGNFATFRRAGGRVVSLPLDQGYGHYILTRDQ